MCRVLVLSHREGELMCCTKHQGVFRFFPQIIDSLLSLSQHFMLILGTDFPTTLCYSALCGYPLWIGRPFRRGGANIDFVLYNAERQYMTDIQ